MVPIPTASVADRPVIEITSGKIMEVESRFWRARTRHIVGYDAVEGARVSSAIDWLNNDGSTGIIVAITRSGRRYHVQPDLGVMAKDIDGTWRRWKGLSGVTTERDVTTEIMGDNEVPEQKKAKKRKRQ